MIKPTCIIPILVIVLLFSCRGTKDIRRDTGATTETTIADSLDNYGLIVSFYSPGNGIDHKMKQKYVDFITNNYPKIIYEKIKWGREGEIDFCFQFNELTENQINQFIKESKEVLSNSSRVHISKNSPCSNKKSP
tara:strand:+ start:1517 stop:1921 length:405 start_codon:yes stop_codon:yes gene_type:complete